MANLPNASLNGLEVQGKLYTLPLSDGSATLGAATNHAWRGRNTVANGEASVVITNNLCTLTSMVVVISATPDEPLVAVVPGAGSFQVYVYGTAGTDIVFNWWLIGP